MRHGRMRTPLHNGSQNMDDQQISRAPMVLSAIHADTERIGFTLASEPKTGALLRALAASKPSGEFLELGTGTGVGTAWLLAGMDARSHLTSSTAVRRCKTSPVVISDTTLA